MSDEKKKHNKITVGFVIQEYEEQPDGSLVCISQEFKAGDSEYENLYGEPVEIDTDKEVYCPLDMVKPTEVIDVNDIVKFVCPACGDHRIEAVLDGSHTTSIETLYKGGGIDYGDTESGGVLERFQCVNCGTVITDDDGEPITDDDELVEWVEKNCS